MSQADLLSSKSVRNFKRNINRTDKVIHQIQYNIDASKALLETMHDYPKRGIKTVSKQLLISERDLSYIYEIGFIALLSNFESFMFDLTKELVSKYPESLNTEKLVSITSIRDFKSINQLIDFHIDAYAIEKTYSLQKWYEYLESVYRVDIFDGNKKKWNMLYILNEIRNCYMHSNSKTTSNFIKHVKPYLHTEIPLNRPIKLDRKKYYHKLYILLKSIAEPIKHKE
jgi:hypothetical protein